MVVRYAHDTAGVLGRSIDQTLCPKSFDGRAVDIGEGSSSFSFLEEAQGEHVSLPVEGALIRTCGSTGHRVHGIGDVLSHLRGQLCVAAVDERAELLPGHSVADSEEVGTLDVHRDSGVLSDGAIVGKVRSERESLIVIRVVVSIP